MGCIPSKRANGCVHHIFLWKWNESYTDIQKSLVLASLKHLGKSEHLISLTCGKNCINNILCQGTTDCESSNPKVEMSQDFDCGLYCVAKDEEYFRKWWDCDDHKAFMSMLPSFAKSKLNLEWIDVGMVDLMKFFPADS